MFEFPLQLVDEFLLEYHVGHALFLLFILVVVGGFLATRSWKVFGANLILFGLIFVLTPIQIHPMDLQFFGLALLVVGPLVLVLSDS